MAEATLKMMLLGDASSANRALKSTADGADHLSDKTNRLRGHMGTLAKVAAVGLAGGLVVAAGAMGKMVRNAAEDQAAQRKLAVALKNTTGATADQVKGVENWISKQGVALGVTDDELRPALQRLVQATGNVTQAQKLAGIAMDASAGSGKSLKVVSEAISKAHNGNMGALSRLGIRIKDTDGKTLSFNDAMKEMSKTFHGQAAAGANTFDGKMSRLKLVFDETKETIGGYLLPILTKLAGWFLDKGLPAVREFFSHMQAGQGVAGGFGRVLGVIGDVIKGVAHWIGDELVPAVRELWGKMMDAAGGTKGLHDTMNSLKPTITVVKEILKVLWAGIKWAAGVVIPLVITQVKLFIQALGVLSKAAIWLWNNGFQPALHFIVQGIAWVIDKFADLLGAIGHIKGFGWAKDAADKLHNAADKAQDLADNIKKIPKDKTVTIHEKHIVTKQGVGGGTYVAKANAVGTRFSSGGLTLVGERGAELVDMPRGSRVHTAEDSERMLRAGNGSGDLGTATLVIATEDGRILEQKLMKLRRDRGGLKLGFA